MALDFGLLNTNAPAQIAGAYGRGQQEAQANQLAQLQMRQQTASTQGAEMNLTRLQQEHDALDKLMTEITANGGPSDPMQAADMMIKSKIPEYFKRGLDMKQSYAQLNNDRVAMGFPPLSSAAAPAPAVSPDRVSEPNAAPGVEVFKVNEQPAPVNALAAQTQAPIESDKNALMMQAKAKLLSPNVGVREAGKLEMQQLLSPKEPVYYNVPGVGLVDPRTGRVVTPSIEKPAAPTNLAKLQNELALLPPGDPRIPQYNALIRKETTHAPAVSVSMVSERAEQGARGTMLVRQYEDISKAAGLADRTLPALESNLSALNKGFDTGFGKETVAAGASVLAALGVKDAEKFATDSQKFQSNAISAVLQKQLEQKGPQTESDAKRIEQIGSQLGKTKNANEFILATAREQLKRDVDQRNFYDRWYKTNKTYDGAEDSWFNGEGGKSLFDRPSLKKYGVSAALTDNVVPAASNRPSLESIFKPK